MRVATSQTSAPPRLGRAEAIRAPSALKAMSCASEPRPISPSLAPLAGSQSTVVARFTVQPGAQFPWHSHAGPVVVNVVSGEPTYVAADDCRERKYPAGTAFVDPGHGHVHTAFNDIGEATVFVATFYGSPAEGPLLIPASPGCS